MNSFYKFLQRLSRFLLKLININYKKNHKFQNKNQVTNTDLILSILAEKISPQYILDIGCGHGEWFLKCYNFFPSSIFSLVIGLSLGISNFGKPNCFIVTNFIKSALFPFLSLKLSEFVS